MFSFRVYGIPKPGGSKKAFFNKHSGKAMIVDACKKNKAWRDSVISAFVDAYPQFTPLNVPLVVSVSFFMPRPKAHYNSKGEVKATSPSYHTHKPDLTKLMRSTEDALTNFAWTDDSLISVQHLTKKYGNPGAEIVITELEATC
jgi:Holliday junction resolvase RusA-like endonuclease